MEQKKAFLDIAVSICPYCGTPYADASWYAIELASDVECGVCGRSWSPKASKVDRFLLEFLLDANGKVIEVKKSKAFLSSLLKQWNSEAVQRKGFS